MAVLESVENRLSRAADAAAGRDSFDMSAYVDDSGQGYLLRSVENAFLACPSLPCTRASRLTGAGGADSALSRAGHLTADERLH